MTVKLLYCYECQTYVNHHKTKSGEWFDWAGHVNPDPDEGERQAEEIKRDAEWLSDAEIERRLVSAK